MTVNLKTIKHAVLTQTSSAHSTGFLQAGQLHETKAYPHVTINLAI